MCSTYVSSCLGMVFKQLFFGTCMCNSRPPRARPPPSPAWFTCVRIKTFRRISVTNSDRSSLPPLLEINLEETWRIKQTLLILKTYQVMILLLLCTLSMCRVPYDNIIFKHSYVNLKLGLLDEKNFSIIASL